MSTVGRTPPAQGEVRCERRADDTLLLRLVGDWKALSTYSRRHCW
jgi:hypothetical protein